MLFSYSLFFRAGKPALVQDLFRRFLLRVRSWCPCSSPRSTASTSGDQGLTLHAISAYMAESIRAAIIGVLNRSRGEGVMGCGHDPQPDA